MSFSLWFTIKVKCVYDELESYKMLFKFCVLHEARPIWINIISQKIYFIGILYDQNNYLCIAILVGGDLAKTYKVVKCKMMEFVRL